MKSTDLVIQGYAKKRDDVWVAICLDFGLAAQGDTADQAMESLNEQVFEYVYDALAGEDQNEVDYLLRRRKAPTYQWLTYYWLRFLYKISLAKDSVTRLITAPIPLPLKRPYGHAT